MDTLEVNFTRLLRGGELDAAQEALARWAAQSGMSESERAVWSSLILSLKGKTQESIDLLSAVIAQGRDIFRTCLSQRAHRYFDKGDFEAALADYRVILEDKTPRVAEIFHLTAQYHVAFCLAELGLTEFVAEIAKVSPAYAEWNKGREWSIDELWALFRKSAAQSGASKLSPEGRSRSRRAT